MINDTSVITYQLPYRFAWDNGYVYIAAGHPTGAFKIGRAKDLLNRGRSFKYHYDFPVRYVWAAHVRDAVSVETMLHRYFKNQRVTGPMRKNEWFYLTDADIALVKRTLLQEASEEILFSK